MFKPRKDYRLMTPAISELQKSLATYGTNEPINRKRGMVKQADLEAEYARSIRAAIKKLKT